MTRGQVVAAGNGPVREGDGLALMSSLRGWPVWQLSPVARRVHYRRGRGVRRCGRLDTGIGDVATGDLGLCALLVGCGAASAELAHRTGEQDGLAWDVCAIWDLPAALLLPPLYFAADLLPRAVLTEWRIRRTLLHRRAYSTAGPCLAYATASLAFRSAAPALRGGGAGPGGPAGFVRVQWDLGSGRNLICAVRRCDPCGGERPSPVACRSRPL
jgi:hypothetical protein